MKNTEHMDYFTMNIFCKNHVSGYVSPVEVKKACEKVNDLCRDHFKDNDTSFEISCPDLGLSRKSGFGHYLLMHK